MTLVHEFISHIAILLELTHQHFTALVDGQFFVLVLKELTNLVPSFAGLDHGKPVTAWPKGIWIGDDFNLVTRF